MLVSLKERHRIPGNLSGRLMAANRPVPTTRRADDGDYRSAAANQKATQVTAVLTALDVGVTILRG